MCPWFRPTRWRALRARMTRQRMERTHLPPEHKSQTSTERPRNDSGPRQQQNPQDIVGAVAQALMDANRILITGHADPDGDVAGGCSALYCAMKRLGKDPVLYNPDPYPPG